MPKLSAIVHRRVAPVRWSALAAPLALLALSLPAQQPAATTPAPQVVTTSQPSFASVVQPSISRLTETLGGIHPDKWKLSGDLHRRTEDNLNSIHQDLTATLPGLLSAADAPPSALVSAVALSRNLDALYDVLLRVTTTSELGAPEPQHAALAGALDSLASARRDLDERVRTGILAQTRQITDLQASLAHTNAALTSANAALQAQTQAKPVTHTARTRTHPIHKKRPVPPAGAPAQPPAQ